LRTKPRSIHYSTSNLGSPSFDAPAGNIAGVSTVNKFGRATAITTGNVWEVWDGNSAYSYPTTATITKLVQATDQVGTDANATIEIQGLDANWALVTQTADLNGADTTTEVTLGTPLIRVFRMKCLENIVLADDVSCVATGGGAIYSTITAGNNQTLMAIYTVPVNKTAYVTNYYATANPGGGAPTTFNISMWAQDNVNTYKPQLKHIQGVSADADAYGRMQHFFNPYYKFTQKTDIIIKGAPTGASVDCSAGFDLFLVDN
jgi:hypothetical protein